MCGAWGPRLSPILCRAGMLGIVCANKLHLQTPVGHRALGGEVLRPLLVEAQDLAAMRVSSDLGPGLGHPSPSGSAEA